VPLEHVAEHPLRADDRRELQRGEAEVLVRLGPFDRRSAALEIGLDAQVEVDLGQLGHLGVLEVNQEVEHVRQPVLHDGVQRHHAGELARHVLLVVEVEVAAALGLGRLLVQQLGERALHAEARHVRDRRAAVALHWRRLEEGADRLRQEEIAPVVVLEALRDVDHLEHVILVPVDRRDDQAVLVEELGHRPSAHVLLAHELGTRAEHRHRGVERLGRVGHQKPVQRRRAEQVAGVGQVAVVAMNHHRDQALEHLERPALGRLGRVEL
tara:strand:+ start:1616 stop:2419 length:804 start_codon:yes stop_codon:yes gene_type:complete